jgi:hypothetical protein
MFDCKILDKSFTLATHLDNFRLTTCIVVGQISNFFFVVLKLQRLKLIEFSSLLEDQFVYFHNHYLN